MTSRTAVYPGSFDPITNGHIDLVKRSLTIFDEVIVAILVNPKKSPLFSVQERTALAQEIFLGEPRVRVEHFDGLLIDFLRHCDSRIIIRGLRAISDFEMEFQMALTNRKLAPEIETFLMVPGFKYTFLNSTIVKELASFGGQISDFVPPPVERALKEKFVR